MKLYFFVLLSFFCFSFTEIGVYDIATETIDGTIVKLSSFKGKKILVTGFNAADPDISGLMYLDSLQSQNAELIIIAVPATDFGGTTKSDNIKKLSASLKHIIITKPAIVKKTDAGKQQPLFKWLTNVTENTHFDIDALSAGQFFIINKNGILYSVLPPSVPKDILNKILNQDII